MITFPSASLETVWYCQANAEWPDTITTSSQSNSFAFMLKSMLLGECMSGSTGSEGPRPTSSFWTVMGSSNGVASGYDGVDRWGTQYTGSNYIRAVSGSSHSWIALRSPMGLGPVYCNIEMNSVTPTQYCIAFSRTPCYATGTQLGRPRHSDEVVAGLATAPGGTTAIVLVTEQIATYTATYRSHISVNASGGFHWMTSRDTQEKFDSYISCTNAVEAQDRDVWPTWIMADTSSGATGAPTLISLGTTAGLTGRSVEGTAANTGGTNIWTFGGTALSAGNGTDVLTGKFHVFPIFVMSFNATLVAYRGRIQDTWMIGAVAIAGSAWPNRETMTHTVVGELLVPFSVLPKL